MELSRQTRIADLSPQARIVLIAALGLAALAAALMLLTRSHSTSETAAPATPTTAATTPVVPATPRPTVAPQPRPAPTPTPVLPAQPALPSSVTSALDSGDVVVVALYDPNVKLDAIALAEAEAGANMVQAAFASVDVTTSDVNGLAERFSILHDPSVLVLRPSGDLAVKLDGFADKDTVAQAAASAQP